MKEIFKIIKEHFILLLGTGFFTFGFFNFSSKFHYASGFASSTIKFIPDTTYPISISTYYYYTDASLILLTIGAIFIVIGLLKMRKKKGEN